MTNKVLKRPHRLKSSSLIDGGALILCWSSPPITAHHQPIVAYLKLGRTLHRILLVSIPDPFSSRPNIKEEKAVWLARLRAVRVAKLIKEDWPIVLQ